MKGIWEEIDRLIEDKVARRLPGLLERKGKRQLGGTLLWLEQILNIDLRNYPFKEALDL